MPREKSIRLKVNVRITDQAEVPPLEAYVFTAGGRLLGHEPVEGGSADMEVPADLDGQPAAVYLGPRPEAGQATPSARALARMGAHRVGARILARFPSVDVAVAGALLPRWCLCFVRGRLVKRYLRPDGTLTERPVCNARVTVCEVDRIPFVIERLPELDLYRLRDELLEKLRPIPRPVGPIPEPDPPPFLRAHAHSAPTEARLPAEPLAGLDVRMAGLAAIASAAQLRRRLVEISDLVLHHICDLVVLGPFLRKDCLTTVEVDHEGRFATLIVHDCKDTPDLYFSVEQFEDGAWHSVYRPSTACGTHWNYDCGTEIVLNVPAATPCEDPGYDLPPGVKLFVLPYAIGYTSIWGTPTGSPPAPFGWLRPDGKVDYATGTSLGSLYGAPFGHTLNFVQDDSYFIPSSGIKYYRYSYRRVNAANPPNTGAADATWTPVTAALGRSYRMEYSDRLPTYESYPVGPFTVGPNQGLFEFKPVEPPARATDPATVVAREWTSGNLSEVAASWDTVASAPPLSADNLGDDAGLFEVKVEVFGPTGAQVMPGSTTFAFLLRNAGGTTTRLATPAEEAGGAYVFRVHVDNNGTVADLPQPSIGGIAASDDCGFLRYEPTDSMLVRFQADHPNDHAVLRFGITRGSNQLAAASTVAPYVEVASPNAATPTAPYAKVGTHYQRSFAPGELVGSCVNAAFAASLNVYGKATNGYHRLGLDASRLIAFALAEHED